MKKIVSLLILCLCLGLCSCKKGAENYKNKGYTSTVVFDFNGGILTNAVTDVKNSIKYAFEPDSYICDPTTLPNCVLRKEGFDFLGWYKDEALTIPWDFTKDKLLEDITLYAKWGTTIKYTYTLTYVDEQTKEEKMLYTYRVEEKEPFVDFLNQANTRENYTAFGFYQDKELTKPWDEQYQHPGGDISLDVKVYVKYIKGVYALVSTYDELIKATGNIYLLNSIDCGGNALKLSKEFDKELQGNGYTISNFKIEAANRPILKYSIFAALLDGAKIENVIFDQGLLEIPSRTLRELRIAGLAGEASGNVTIRNVKITNSKIVVPAGLNLSSGGAMSIEPEKAIYDTTNANVIIEDFSSSYVVEDLRS